MRTALTVWSAGVFVLLWVGFVALLVSDPDGFSNIEDWVGRRPTVVRIGVWVLFLPMVIGLKIWTSSSSPVRVIGMVAITLWTAASVASMYRLLTGE